MKRIPPEAVNHLAWKSDLVSYSGLFNGKMLDGPDYKAMIGMEQDLGIIIKNKKCITGNEAGFVEEAGHVIAIGLTNIGLTQFPVSIAGLDSLRRLWLDHNEMQVLPAEIGNLNGLIGLNVQSNPLRNIPRSISRLQNLRTFNASSCELVQIPEALGSIMTLESISLAHNRLRDLPDSIGNLPFLKALRLSDNPIEQIPQLACQSLSVLDLGNMKLRAVPESLYALGSLRKLVLRTNNLKSLSFSIGNLGSLRELDLSNNHLQSLPETIIGIKDLIRLDLSHNQIVPSESIMNWLEELKARHCKVNDASMSGNADRPKEWPHV
jgi:Leucine-rich repeat (LRR) protein